MASLGSLLLLGLRGFGGLAAWLLVGFNIMLIRRENSLIGFEKKKNS